MARDNTADSAPIELEEVEHNRADSAPIELEETQPNTALVGPIDHRSGAAESCSLSRGQ